MEYRAPIEPVLNGQYQPDSSRDTSSVADILTIYNKDRIPQEFPLIGNRIGIGRTEDNEIVLNNKAISRHHALLERNDDGWWITDLGSTNGVIFGKTRVAAQQAVRWSANTKVKLGPFEMSWQRQLPEEADDRTQLHIPQQNTPQQAEIPEETADPMSEFAEVTLKLDRQNLAVGETLNAELTLVNMGTSASDFRIFVDGIPSNWVDIGEGLVHLRPAEVQHARFAIIIPETELDARGIQTVEVVIESVGNNAISASDRGSFTIEEIHDFELMVRQIAREDQSMCDVAIMNRGNAADFYSISAASSNGELDFNARQWQMALTPTTQDHLRIQIIPRSRPLIGADRLVPYVITAVSNSGIEKSYYGEIGVPPRLTLKRVAIICLAIILLSFVIWLALSFLPSDLTGGLTNYLAEIIASATNDWQAGFAAVPPTIF